MVRHAPFSGPNEPLQIFQDDTFDRGVPMTSHAPMPSVTKPLRRALSTSNSSNVVFQPPTSSNSSLSPHKAQSSSPRSPLKAQGNKLNMVSMAPPASKGPTTDSLLKRPHLSKFKTGPQRPLYDAGYGKENVHPQIFPAPPTINLSVESYYTKPGGKRGLLDAPSIKDGRSAKKTKMDDTALPPHDSFPPITDDGAKPPHSYAQLIGMAILRSPLRRLTLAQIYKWISDNYSFYNPNDAGWQNSIRHNLSLHKNFLKIERPKDDPGKGNYWGIEPGTELQFLKEKPSRKSNPTAENLPVMSTRLEPSRPGQTTTTQEPTLPPPSSSQLHSTLPPLPTSQATISMPAELSSDATIPVSDNIESDGAVDKMADNDLPLDSSLYSPLPATMHSSPPVTRHAEAQSGTPPPRSQNLGSSAPRSHARKFASMDDSGYISSLESSAMRPNQKAMLLTSEADRPRIKRGRAEEEIARLRNSSPFSPTKSRSMSAYGPVSSSPLRQANENQALPPLTPVVKMRPPVRPPPSASPNTNLRIHRDKVRHMLQSPLRRVTGVGEDALSWSPAFHLEESIYTFDDMGMPSTEFDIFHDLGGIDDAIFPGIGSVDAGSPVKRTVKRARLDRSVSTSALGELTNSATKKSITSAPLLRISENSPSQFLDTPSKAFEGLSSPSKLFQQSPLRMATTPSKIAMLELPVDADWPSLVMDPSEFASHSTEGTSDFAGLDILQGFEKIGAGSQASRSQKRGKPTLSRSFSTAF